ncbi:hypothetical protein GCM10023114_36250 [Mycolicibacterium sediminis]|uniref:Uncharacterized protein n=2 Tax=Mycolicibacterium sediminis TaxID=1286180 RepID=A0A7I7QY56_9MYCO|nr:hypothetical protein MSEDJ_54190 [Mycolicibacterium sediminis]
MVLGVLTFDGVLSAVAGSMFLPLFVGAIPLPISGLVSGALNLALVWAAWQWTSSVRVAALPLWAWLVTVVGLSLGGPGGDIVFGGPNIMAAGPLVMLALGLAPPLVLISRRTRVVVPDRAAASS